VTDKIDMIYDMVKETNSDIKQIKTDMTAGAIRMENHSVRLKNIEESQKRLETGQKKIKKDLFDHIGDKKKHYNQGYKETIPQRIMRKKVELTVITIITTILGWLVNNYFGG